MRMIFLSKFRDLLSMSFIYGVHAYVTAALIRPQAKSSLKLLTFPTTFKAIFVEFRWERHGGMASQYSWVLLLRSTEYHALITLQKLGQITLCKIPSQFNALNHMSSRVGLETLFTAPHGMCGRSHQQKLLLIRPFIWVLTW